MFNKAPHLCRTLFYIVLAKLLLLLIVLYYANYGGRVTWKLPIGLVKHNFDRRPPPTKSQLDELMAKELPSLPLKQLLHHEGKQYRLNESCAPFAELMDIKFQNEYWQVANGGEKTYYIYSAYYDYRPTLSDIPKVRLMAMINEIENRYPAMFCQLWFKDTLQPLIVPVAEYDVPWYKDWGSTKRHFYPTVVTCNMPEDGALKYQVPETVSLVANECDRATNNLRVQYELPEDVAKSSVKMTSTEDNNESSKKSFAVCVKPLDFAYNDISNRMVEWLELLRLLGADKVTIYNSQLHPNTSRVLRYYAKSNGFVDFRDLAMARGEPHTLPNFQHLIMSKDKLNRVLHEVISYNDCFYRNMYKYDYIVICDIDEVIMPLGNLTNWSDLINTAYHVPNPYHPDEKCNDWVSYCFRNVYYPRYPMKPPHYDNLPSYFYMLQHVERVAEHLDPNSATKCIHSTNYVIAMFNHLPIKWHKSCGPKSVPIDLAQMQHYREPDINKTLLNPVVDDNIWRFGEPLIERSNAVMKELGFFK